MKIVYAYKQVDRYTTLSKRFNFPRSTIQRIIKKYKAHCVDYNFRKRLISERMKKKIVRDVSKNSQLMAKNIVNYIHPEVLNVSKKTVTRCLHRAGIRACRPRKSAMLKAKHLKTN